MPSAWAAISTARRPCRAAWRTFRNCRRSRHCCASAAGPTPTCASCWARTSCASSPQRKRPRALRLFVPAQLALLVRLAGQRVALRVCRGAPRLLLGAVLPFLRTLRGGLLGESRRGEEQQRKSDIATAASFRIRGRYVDFWCF